MQDAGKQKPKATKHDRSLAKRAEPIVAATGKMAPVVRTLSEPLTHQDEATLGYLVTLTNPVHVTHPVAPPLALGVSALRTIKTKVKMAVTLVANSSGFACCHMLDDRWNDNTGGSAETRLATAGGTGGSAVWYTNGSYSGTTGPGAGASTAVPGLLSVSMPTIDPALTTNSQTRLIAFGLEFAPIDASDITAGQAYLVSTTDPYSTTNPLVEATQTKIENCNDELIAVNNLRLAGWKSNQTASTFGVPSDPAAFAMFMPGAGGTGSSHAAYPTLGVYVYGAASGQKMYVRLSYVYEFEKPNDNRLDGVPDPSFVTSPAGEISHMLTLAHGYNGATGKRPVHKPTGLHNPAGVQAFTQNLMDTRPLKLPSLAVEAKKPSYGWMDAAKAGLSFIADTVTSFLPPKLKIPATFIKQALFD